jgi:basic amino acid/polyamine antiporter, APA family
MTITDVVALGVSASIGVSIFSVFSPATSLAGPAVLAALALALVPMCVFLVVYSVLAVVAPASGSSFVWPTRFVHPYLGFVVAWLRLLAFAGAANIMASVFFSYLSEVVSVPRLPVMLGLLTAFSAINYFGVGLTGKANRALVGAKLVAILGFIALGLPNVRWSNFFPFVPHGTLGVLATLPLLAGLFGGIESAAEIGDEIRNTRATAPKGMALAVLISFVVYAGTAVIIIGVLGAPAAAAGSAPLALAAGKLIGGPVALYGVVAIALISIAAALNTLILITSRFLFAMGRDGVLPTALGRIHPITGTPYVAIVTTYALGLLSFLLPSSLVFLFLAANAPTVLKYGSNCVAAIRMVNKHPALLETAALKLGPRAIRLWAYAGIGCAVGILAAGLATDLYANMLLAAWAALGSIYWALRTGRIARNSAVDC